MISDLSHDNSTNRTNSNDDHSVDAALTGMAIIGGIAALGYAIANSGDDSESSATHTSTKDNTIYVGDKVECFIWGKDGHSGYYGRVADESNDK